MTDRPAFRAPQDNVSVIEIEAAARRLMSALDALEGAVEERNDTDRSEDELAARIQSLGTDRSRLAAELDAALVRARRLERTNREIAARLEGAIGAIESVIDHEGPL